MSDDRQAEIEAVGREICAYANSIEKRHAAVECRREVFLNYEDWRDEYDEEARVVIAAIDRIRAARHDDEADQLEDDVRYERDRAERLEEQLAEARVMRDHNQRVAEEAQQRADDLADRLELTARAAGRRA